MQLEREVIGHGIVGRFEAIVALVPSENGIDDVLDLRCDRALHLHRADPAEIDHGLPETLVRALHDPERQIEHRPFDLTGPYQPLAEPLVLLIRPGKDDVATVEHDAFARVFVPQVQDARGFGSPEVAHDAWQCGRLEPSLRGSDFGSHGSAVIANRAPKMARRKTAFCHGFMAVEPSEAMGKNLQKKKLPLRGPQLVTRPSGARVPGKSSPRPSSTKAS